MQDYELHRMGKDELAEMWTTWFYSFKTREEFAEEKGITIEVATDLLEAGESIVADRATAKKD